MNTITLTYQQDNVFAQKMMLNALLAFGGFNIEKTRQTEINKASELAKSCKFFMAKNVINQCLA